MKDTHFLYSIATFGLGSVIAIFVGCITNTLPMHTQRYSAPTLVRTPAKKKCVCCTQRTPQEKQEFIKQRKRYKRATTLIRQYGLEEGLLRIKQSDPAAAEVLEKFTKKGSVAVGD